MRRGFLVNGTILTVAGVLILLPGVQLAQIYLLKSAQPGIFVSLIRLSGGIVVALGLQAIVRARLPRSEAPKQVKEMLGPNEKVQLYVQQTNFFPNIFGRHRVIRQPRPWSSWILTNERVIQRQRYYMKLKNHYQDYSYADITSLRIDQGIFRSTIRGEVKLESKDENVEFDIEPQKKKMNKGELKNQVEMYKPQIEKLEEGLEPSLVLDGLAKSDARKADGIIRENMVRFRTPFFQTPFPSDKVAYGATQNA